MRRRLFTILSALSAVLFMFAAVLWVRGFWISDTLIVAGWRMGLEGATGRFLYLGSDCNQFSLTYRWQHAPLSPEELTTWQRRPPPMIQFAHGSNRTPPFTLWSADRRWLWERAGFDYHTSDDLILKRPGLFDRSLSVPFWFMLVAFGALPAIRMASLWRAWKQRRSGLCPTCGYDLRASIERCPECGTPIPAQPTSSGGKA